MSKTIKKIRNIVLAFLLSAGMIFGVIPGSVVFADEVTEQASVSFGEVFVESGYTQWKSENGAAGGIGTLSYVDGTKLRARSLIEPEYNYQANQVLTVNYNANFDCSGISVLLCNKNEGGYYITLGSLVNGQTSVSFTLPETSVFNETVLAKYVRFQGSVGAEGSQIEFTGISIGNGASVEPDPVSTAPTVEIEESDGYSISRAEDGSVTATYTEYTWYTLNAHITNCDYTKYSRVIVDLTPYEGMNLGIYNDRTDIAYRSHWGSGEFESGERQTVSFDLQENTDYLRFYCDPPVNGQEPGGQHSFTIHSIKIVDPTTYVEPGTTLTEKAHFTGFSAESNCSLSSSGEGGIGTVTYDAGATVKLRALFDSYTYKAGDVLVIDYDGIDNIETLGQVIMGYSTSSNCYVTLKTPTVEGNRAIYTLPDSGEFFNETQPTFIRFKCVFSTTGNTTTFNGFHIYDAKEYAEFMNMEPEYKSDECPKGLAVSYYTDIYSRGFAWSTNDAVTVSNLEYVKAEEGWTSKDVDWSKATLVSAGMIESEDAEGVIWHLFKTHLTELEPGSKYFFRAGHIDTGYSSVGSFTIEGAPETIDKLTFVHLTDCQEDSEAGYTKWAKVLDAAYKIAPDSKFVAFTGDLTNDSHKSLSMKQWIWGLEEPRKTLLNTVIEPVAGNHDNYPQSFTNRFDIDWWDYDNGDVTDLKTGGCYSFTYGDDIVFIGLNTNDSEGGEDTYGVQKQYLINELEKYKDCKWKIIQVHRGMMTTGNHTNDGELDWLREVMPPIFAKYGVDLVLQGHDHVYTRTRTYYTGYDFDGNMYDGLTPCWLDGEIIENYDFGGNTRMVNLEPTGTHYVTINYCASKTYPVETDIDEVIYIGKNPFDENGCSIQPNLPMYGVVQIDGDKMTYDAYTYNTSTKESKLYDTFTVDKNNTRGYRDRNEGKDEVFLQGISVESKKYDGKPVKLNLKGFVCSEPEIMDYTTLSFNIVGRDGTDYSSTTELPREVGSYTLEISISTKNRLYYGTQSIDFDITQ